MSRMSFTSPFLLGFEDLEKVLERLAKADAYPPYNVESSGPGRLKITLAVAGFSIEELSVTVEDSQLIIRGRQGEATDKTFIHRGIARRQFQRSFVLAEGMQVVNAELHNGLLSIELERPPRETRVRTIPIRSADVQAGSVTQRMGTRRLP